MTRWFFFALAVLLFTSCSKTQTTTPVVPSPYYIKATINGVERTFKADTVIVKVNYANNPVNFDYTFKFDSLFMVFNTNNMYQTNHSNIIFHSVNSDAHGVFGNLSSPKGNYQSNVFTATGTFNGSGLSNGSFYVVTKQIN